MRRPLGTSRLLVLTPQRHKGQHSRYLAVRDASLGASTVAATASSGVQSVLLGVISGRAGDLVLQLAQPHSTI